MRRTATALLLLTLLTGCSDDGAAVARPGESGAPRGTARALADDPSAATVDLDVVATATRRLEVTTGLAGVAAARGRSADVRGFAADVARRQGPRSAALQALVSDYAIDCCGTHTEAGSPLESALRADVPRLERADPADVDLEFLHRLLEHEALLAPALQQEVDRGTHRPAVALATALLADQQADAERAGQLLDGLRGSATG